MERFDKGAGIREKDYVHFRDGAALNKDGTWKHGSRKLTNKGIRYLEKNGWKIPE